ncbi:hydantoinase B/oxoprolinase family protein [Baekduia soli]|uniref:Hydantoinase B/oxoprolinase family protein n=1 Tax=Baekduia soli TaxID=496014 RepID=A0A5B8U2J5_9ACTN|nr:hydantoinase B/oxoprolinase family protein [Baekduia soli]QEC47234.1 hydantoinase B/oxoprolinase family protein [Baekduia soli]
MTDLIESPETRIKDLSDAEFEARYNCERFTASVLGSRFRYLVQHMCTGLLNNAFSVILRDWYDFAATISGPPSMGYPMPAVSNSLVLFIGTMGEAVRNAVTEYGPENLRQGDILMVNDPYRCGTHVNDVCFIRPVFYEGEIVAFVNLQPHMLDMGGVVPGGFAGTKKDVFENGLVIAPQLLYREDVPVKHAWSMIFDNARFGGLLLPDIKTTCENLRLGERQMLETIERYGLDSVHGAMRYSCDVSAETMGDAVMDAVPDGVYEAEDLALDADGQADDEGGLKIHVKIVKKGRRVEVDLSGSSRQARTSINAGYLDTKTAVGVAFKYLFDPVSPFTSGAYRDIDIVIPEASICNAYPMDGAIFLYWESSMSVLNTIFRALGDALGEKAIAPDFNCLSIHNANGVLEDGTPWLTAAQCGGEHGPWGATSHGDADSYQVFYLANNIDPATEAIEADIPAVVLRKEYMPDSGGPGYNRGGAAVLKDTLFSRDTDHYSMPLHFKEPSGTGVNGGGSAGSGGAWVIEPEVFDVPKEQNLPPKGAASPKDAIPVAGVLNADTKLPDPEGEYYYFARVPIWKTKPNTVFRYLTNGGGGWGTALDREPERVMVDVRDGYVSIEGAKRDYGVIVNGDPENDPEGLTVDTAATEKLREEMRSAA